MAIYILVINNFAKGDDMMPKIPVDKYGSLETITEFAAKRKPFNALIKKYIAMFRKTINELALACTKLFSKIDVEIYLEKKGEEIFNKIIKMECKREKIQMYLVRAITLSSYHSPKLKEIEQNLLWCLEEMEKAAEIDASIRADEALCDKVCGALHSSAQKTAVKSLGNFAHHDMHFKSEAIEIRKCQGKIQRIEEKLLGRTNTRRKNDFRCQLNKNQYSCYQNLVQQDEN